MGFFDFFKRNKEQVDAKQSPVPSVTEPADSELKNELIAYIQQEVHFGFDSETEILQSAWDYGIEDEDQLDEHWLRQVIGEYYRRHQEESKGWSRPTDFDRLAKAFDELNSEGIIALHKAGYTKQDGYSDVGEVIHMLDSPIKPLGYCFYHTQDLERAIDPEIQNLFLAFDDIRQDDEHALLVGRKIVAKLNENGLKTEWDGTIDQRIEIKNIYWQKVPDGQDWGMERAVRHLRPGN